MAEKQRGSVTKVKVNNSKENSSITKQIELVLVDGRLVPEFRESEPGVIIR